MGDHLEMGDEQSYGHDCLRLFFAVYVEYSLKFPTTCPVHHDDAHLHKCITKKFKFLLFFWNFFFLGDEDRSG